MLDNGRARGDELWLAGAVIRPISSIGVTREPRARDSGAKGGTGTKEYW